MDLGNFKMFNVQNNWLTVTAKQPEISETYLNLKPEKELMKIYCETLKCKQLSDRIVAPIFFFFSSQNRPGFKDQKLVCRKSSCFKLLAISKNKYSRYFSKTNKYH